VGEGGGRKVVEGAGRRREKRTFTGGVEG